jgi:hypothetical protein
VTDIVAEYLEAMRRMPLVEAQRLHTDFRFPWRSIVATCPVPTRVSFTDATKQLYQPGSDGFPVWVLPVTCVDPEQPEEIEATDPLAVISCGHVVDLLAFDPECPRRFVRRTGLAPVLGVIEPQRCDPNPVPVWRDVTDWLRAECVGIVLLTDDPFEAGRIMRRITTVQAEDARHGEELRERVNLPPYPVEFTTAILAMRRAA